MRLPSVVIVTAPTRYQGLLARWGTRGQAKFRLKQAMAHQIASRAASAHREAVSVEADFDLYEQEFQQYETTVDRLRERLEVEFPITLVERRYLPSFEFRNAIVVVVIGPDGLVANTAKYVGELPIVGVNPDPRRNDGVLLPFDATSAPKAVKAAIDNRANVRRVTLAEAVLNDGQRLLAFNDLFIGRRSHVSARYNLNWRGEGESQSSSGVIVATGAGSTGWLSSVFNMMHGVNAWTGGQSGKPPRWPWHDRKLAWVVREPFASRHSQARLVGGMIDQDGQLELESLMPDGGVIFSDGIEEDFLEFNSGATARIQFASTQAHVVVP